MSSSGMVAFRNPVICCCHDYQKLVAVHGGLVLLFTDDIQLSITAMMNSVWIGNRKVRCCISRNYDCFNLRNVVIDEGSL